jgi:hypothetical protein
MKSWGMLILAGVLLAGCSAVTPTDTPPPATVLASPTLPSETPYPSPRFFTPAPISWRIIGTYAAPVDPLALGEGVVYLGLEDGLAAVSLADPANPALLVEVTGLGARVQGLVYASGRLYAATTQGFSIYTIPSPAELLVAGGLEDPLGFKAVAVRGKTAFLLAGSGMASQLWAVDVSDPYTPTRLGFANFSNETFALALHGEYALVGYGQWLAVVDARNPAEMAVVSRLDFPGAVTTLAVQGETACVGVDGGYIYLVDLSQPSQPVIQGFVVLYTPRALALDTGAGRLYAAAGERLHVLDISEPANPRILSGPGLPIGAAVDLQAGAGVVYAAVEGQGLVIVGIYDEENP